MTKGEARTPKTGMPQEETEKHSFPHQGLAAAGHGAGQELDETVTVYRPNMRHELGLFQTWAVMSRNVWTSRELIWQLFKRDFLAVYKKSFLGFAWIFIMPIAGVISWIFLRKSGVLKPGNVGIPYTAYVLVGTSMWGFFMRLFQAASSSLHSGRALVMQVSFPHEALLFKQAAQQVATFAIAFVLNIAVLLVYRITLSWWILAFPLVAFPLFLFATAFGLVVAMISIVAVDVERVINMGMGFLMYLTPVIYASSGKPALVQSINRWNPLTHLVCSCRDIVVYGRLYDTNGYLWSSAVAFVLFLIAWRMFYVGEQKLIERMI